MKCKVIIWDINKEALDRVGSCALGASPCPPSLLLLTEKEIKDASGDVTTYVCDLSKRDNIYATAEKVKALCKVDILINNAGIVSGKTFLNVSDEAAQRTVDVNTTAHFWTTKVHLAFLLVLAKLLPISLPVFLTSHDC